MEEKNIVECVVDELSSPINMTDEQIAELEKQEVKALKAKASQEAAEKKLARLEEKGATEDELREAAIKATKAKKSAETAMAKLDLMKLGEEPKKRKPAAKKPVAPVVDQETLVELEQLKSEKAEIQAEKERLQERLVSEQCFKGIAEDEVECLEAEKARLAAEKERLQHIKDKVVDQMRADRDQQLAQKDAEREQQIAEMQCQVERAKAIKDLAIEQLRRDREAMVAQMEAEKQKMLAELECEKQREIEKLRLEKEKAIAGIRADRDEKLRQAGLLDDSEEES